MARNEIYQEFLDHLSGRKPDDLPQSEEIPATQQEVGWWKQYQIRRALRHARMGVATPVELHLLASHEVTLPSRASDRTRTKLHDEFVDLGKAEPDPTLAKLEPSPEEA